MTTNMLNLPLVHVDVRLRKSKTKANILNFQNKINFQEVVKIKMLADT